MNQFISPDAVLHAMKSGIPDAEWLLGQIESEHGWLRFPPYLSSIITNLKIEAYPLLYCSEGAIAAMLLKGWMTTEEIQILEAELEVATPEERGNFLIDLCADLETIGEEIEQLEIPKTPAQRRAAEAQFNAMSPEEQAESVRLAQHFFVSSLPPFIRIFQ